MSQTLPTRFAAVIEMNLGRDGFSSSATGSQQCESCGEPGPEPYLFGEPSPRKSVRRLTRFIPAGPFREARERRQFTEPRTNRLCWRAAPSAAGGDIAIDVGRPCDLRTLSDPQVTDHTDLTAENHVILQSGRARNSHTGNDDAVASDHDVMGDLHQVIDLGAL